MTYQIEFTDAARQAAVHLPPEIKQRIKEALRFLSANPFAGEPLLRELWGKRKLRVGRYRLIYLLETQRKTILILAIGPRRDIYKLRFGRT